LIGRPYGEQLRLKSDRVRAVLASSSAVAGVDVADVLGSPRVFGYRNQAKLVVRRARRGLLLGIYRPGTHQVVDIRECPVHHPLVTRALSAALRRRPCQPVAQAGSGDHRVPPADAAALA
jgi:23S rRNA (uracil1939-C5)-methyltransferase